MKNRIPGVLFSALFFSVSAIAQETTVFQEKNGELIVEIESAEAIGNWNVDTALGDYKGSSYYQWAGPSYFSSTNAGNSTLTYHFNIATPGNYEFRWRSYIGIGEDSHEHNDSWVKFPTGSNIEGEHPISGWTKAYMSNVNRWSWIARTVDGDPQDIRQYFAAGDHTIEISGRSEGHAIDRFVLYKYEDLNWSTSRYDSVAESYLVGEEPEGTTTDGNTDTETETTPLPDWSTTQAQLTFDECSANQVAPTLQASLFTDNGDVMTGELMKIDYDQSKVYLQYDLSNIPADLSGAVLTFNIGNDGGSGTLNISAGSHSDWDTSTSTIEDLPNVTLTIDSLQGQWESDTKVALPLNPGVLGNEKLTLILDMQADANDLSIRNTDITHAPQLILTNFISTFCDDYAALQAPVEEEEEPVDEGSEEVPPEENNEGEENNEDDTGDPVTDLTTDQANSGIDSGGSGAIGFYLFLALLLTLGTRRQYHLIKPIH